MLLLLAVAQAATSVSAGKIDLTSPQPCEANPSTNDDIIVCGRRREDSNRYRIPESSTREADVPKAEWQVGDGMRVSTETERVDFRGVPSNRVMVRLKFKF